VQCLTLRSTQELLDDVRRHKSDSVVNHRLVTVLRASGEVQARWQELRVGDVVKVRVAAAARTVIESAL
jgi:magnesium-transporting ATPase (P-type)